MMHPIMLYDQARMKIAEDIRQAERERLFRQAVTEDRHRAIDSVPLRTRVARLLGLDIQAQRPGTAGA
jgi:hypothetical protein